VAGGRSQHYRDAVTGLEGVPALWWSPSLGAWLEGVDGRWQVIAWRRGVDRDDFPMVDFLPDDAVRLVLKCCALHVATVLYAASADVEVARAQAGAHLAEAERAHPAHPSRSGPPDGG
jgi:hypothetical protein